MTDLLSHLQSLTAPDREIDAKIALAHGWKRYASDQWADPYWHSPDNHICPNVPRYTGSLDAVRRLIPDDLYWIMAKGKTRPDEPLYGVQILRPTGNPKDVIAEAEHDLLEVALLIAIMKAEEESKT
jgi:hypothetical protein